MKPQYHSTLCAILLKNDDGTGLVAEYLPMTKRFIVSVTDAHNRTLMSFEGEELHALATWILGRLDGKDPR